MYIKYKYDCISLTKQKKKEKAPGGGLHWNRVIADINKQQVSILVLYLKHISFHFPGWDIEWR